MMQSETVYPTPPRQTIVDCRKFAETIKPSRQITQSVYALPPSTWYFEVQYIIISYVKLFLHMIIAIQSKKEVHVFGTFELLFWIILSEIYNSKSISCKK